jgi:rhamnogalacturonan endolyase
MKLLPKIIVVGIALGALAPSALGADKAAGTPVKLIEDEVSFTLANGYVTARVEKRSGVLSSLKYKGQELLGKASGVPYGYWSFVGGGSLSARREASVRVDPKDNGGNCAVVSCRVLYRQEARSLPVDVDMRYALGRGDQGIYAYAIWDHKPSYPGFSLAEARYCMKLNEQVFDYMTVDAKRRKVMPTPADWDKGTPLNMKEARRMTTGKYAGQPEHKYDYSAVQFDTPAYGWSSSKHHVGLWMINPSIEYLSGGPTKVELTAHLDVNRGAAPTLLNYWKGSHYGSSSLAVREKEVWTKCIGPFLIYCNAGGDHEAMWKDALAKAADEARAWPYDWVKDPVYPSKEQRGAVTGQIVLKDPLVSIVKVSNLLVGLAPPDYTITGGRRGGRTVDWQYDAKYYQFWVRADGQGRFQIRNIRPGTYTLHAFADGVLGEFSLANIAVAVSKTKDLGRLEWKPVRYGRQVWEIGIPNRSADEFRHGDHYWQWGLYNQYPKEFPNDVNFVIGKSDWRKDWNYCQPPRIEDGRAKSTTWSITFDLPEAPRGQATLRLAIAGSQAQRGIEVMVNDKSVGGTGPLPATGVMHRDGIRGYWCERSVKFDAARLKRGTNVIKLTVPATSWVQGVLYDYLRLELDESAHNK